MIWILSGEFFLDYRPNGGSVVLLRAAWVTLLGYIAVILLQEILNPHSTLQFSLQSFRKTAFGSLSVAGAIFAGVYAALYARFASQWTYLAGVYNQIMAAKVRGGPETQEAQDALDTWEAGFVEDAEELHLATKPMFAGVILSMIDRPGVREVYVQATPGGEERLIQLEKQVRQAYQDAAIRWQRKRG